MRRTQLGRTGATVAAIGLGCAGMAKSYDTPNEPEANAAMTAALEGGIDFFDTSDLYGVGNGERLIGRFLAQDRRRVMIATKFGSMPGAADGVGAGGRSVNNDPAYIPIACDASLRRLGLDVIDLYIMHRRDPAIPVADSVGAMSRLVEAGKVRWLGLSEVSAGTLRAAHRVHPITTLQSEYSLWMRDCEAEILPACRELGVTFVPFCPLGRGFLTGQLAVDTLAPHDFRSHLPRFRGEAARQNAKLVAALVEFATTRQISPAQTALAWLLAMGRTGPSIVPIPGASRPRHIAENAAAAAIELDGGEVAALNRLFAPDAIVGDRYTPEEAVRAGT